MLGSLSDGDKFLGNGWRSSLSDMSEGLSKLLNDHDCNVVRVCKPL